MTATINDVRNADLPTILQILQDQQARKIDLVVPGSKLSFGDGDLVLSGLEQIVEEDGVTDPNGRYQLTPTFVANLAARLDIHASTLRRLRGGRDGTRQTRETDVPRMDLFDGLVNGLLHGRREKWVPVDREDIQVRETLDHWRREGDLWYERTTGPMVPGDPRSHMVRLFRSDWSGRGIARGLFSNKYFRIEDYDSVLAILAGIEEAGIDPSTLRITGDISETRTYLHIQAPEIAAWAPEFLDGYRSPFEGGDGPRRAAGSRMSGQERAELGQRLVAERGWGHGGRHLNAPQGGGHGAGHGFYKSGEEPILYAGITVRNSELGNGRLMAAPEITVLACDNGLVQTKDAFARTHLGSKVDDGHVEWSADTNAAELTWVKKQTRDLVKMALSQDYLDTKVAEITEVAGKGVTKDRAVQVLSKVSSFTKADQEGILEHFLVSGQRNAGGLLQAVTSFSQTLPSADAAHEMNEQAMAVLEFAAR